MESYGGNDDAQHISNIKSLLTEYYHALTHVCSTGLQLAGRLEKELKSPRHVPLPVTDTIGSEAPFYELVHKMSQIKSHYSEIISKLGPLWEQIQCKSPYADEAMEEQWYHNQNNNRHITRVEGICKCLVEFHKSAIESGVAILDQKSSSKHSKLPLTRKASPCIVITDTDSIAGSAQRSERLPKSSKVGRPRCTTPKHSAKIQPPSDDDMNNIINFLSSTRGPPVKRDHSPGMPRHVALANQRSSPLPVSSEGAVQNHGGLNKDLKSGFVRHHSDWQLFAHAAPQKDTGTAAAWGMNNYTMGQITCNSYETNRGSFSTNTACAKPLPFSSWSSAVNKDSIWSNEYTASSGDESTDRNFRRKYELPSTLVGGDSSTSMYRGRRPSDSSDGSQTFDPVIASMNQQPQSTVNLTLSSTSPSAGAGPLSNDVWSIHPAVAQCWPNSTVDDTASITTDMSYGAMPRSLSSTGICDQNAIWKPLGSSSLGMVPLCSIITTSGAQLIHKPIASPCNHTKIKSSHSNLL